ncbi:MAG: hypothetical protein IAI48_06820, partial [Candidatus Eremiobacteraeota bacterium]|nr:hypothetical protein [Candidatus Eremiobacteraeota bacterium]
MSNSSTITIACALCVGAAREPYLEATLASIADCVDVLCVNDNSGLARSDNVATLERSAFAARGALRIERHPFVDFADMRDRAYAQVVALERAPDWMLFLDADEVHGEQVRYVAREILPSLAASVGSVDAYTYHLYGTYRWMTDVARRFCFYRYAPGVRWVNAVHEKIVGVRGDTVVLPYVYHHYGNVVPPAALARKYGTYYALGNPVAAAPPSEADATLDMYLHRAAEVRPYESPHPRAARATLAALEAEYAAEFAVVDAGFRARRTFALRAAAAFRG